MAHRSNIYVMNIKLESEKKQKCRQRVCIQHLSLMWLLQSENSARQTHTVLTNYIHLSHSMIVNIERKAWMDCMLCVYVLRSISLLTCLSTSMSFRIESKSTLIATSYESDTTEQNSTSKEKKRKIKSNDVNGGC